MGTIKIPAAEVLKKIYGETEESSARYTNLAVNFEKKYHHDKAEFFTAPGRTEIIGNQMCIRDRLTRLVATLSYSPDSSFSSISGRRDGGS